MKGFYSAALALGLGCSTVAAHGYIEKYIIDGQEYVGYNPYIDPVRNPPPPRIAYPLVNNWPTYDPMSPNITCGYNPPSLGSPQIAAKARAGTNMTLTWTTWPSSHFGPTMTYMTFCGASCEDFDVHDEDVEFFKIHHDGYRANSKIPIWFTDEFHNENSTLTLRLPQNIPDGEYIVRHELLSLHAVHNEEYGPEFYPSCFRVAITDGKASTLPTEGLVRFPGAYSMSDPGIDVTKDGPWDKYIIPGGPVIVT